MALWSIFLTVFLAELGDKTQLATLLFAADGRTNRWGVFLASSGALVLSTLIAVLVGGQLSAYLSPRLLKIAAGVGFMAIGAWVLIDAHAGLTGWAHFVLNATSRQPIPAYSSRDGLLS